MLLTPWLDSWLGHISTDVSPHGCPAISTIHQAVTPTEVTVIFDEKRYFTHKLMHTISLLLCSCTKSHHYSVIFCEAFLFTRISWHAGKIFADVLSTCHLAGWDNIFSQWWCDIFDILPTWWHLSGQHVIWGGLGDMTWCQHFQLSRWHPTANERHQQIKYTSSNWEILDRE